MTCEIKLFKEQFVSNGNSVLFKQIMMSFLIDTFLFSHAYSPLLNRQTLYACGSRALVSLFMSSIPGIFTSSPLERAVGVFFFLGAEGVSLSVLKYTWTSAQLAPAVWTTGPHDETR